MMRQKFFNFTNRQEEKPCRANQSGQGLLEYIIIIALVGIAVIGAVNIMSPAISDTFERFVDAEAVAPPALANYTPPPPTAAEPTNTPTTYNLAVNIESETGSSGSTNPSGLTNAVQSGKPYTLTVTTGDYFYGWTGDIDSLSKESFVMMDGDKAVTANFRVKCYRLDAAVSLGSVGSISQSPESDCSYGGPNMFRAGSDVVLTAVVDPAVDFYGWTGPYFSGNLNHNAVVTIHMAEDTKVRAQYESKCQKLATGGTGINLSYLPGAECPDGSANNYAYNARVTLTANPNDDQQFDHWAYGLITETIDALASSTTNPLILNMTDDMQVHSYYTVRCFTLTKTATGGSIQIVSPAAPTCGGTGYSWNDNVVVKAIPDADMNFTSWSGDASGTAITTTVNIRRDVNVVANFGGCQTLAVNYTGSGSVNLIPAASACGSGRYPAGTDVGVRAIPATGSQLLNWSGDASGNSENIVVNVNVDKAVTANFEACYTLTTNVSGNGSVTDSGTVCSTDSSKYAPQTTTTVNANPDSGNRFTGWSGDLLSDVNPAEILMNGDKSVTASFATCNPLPSGWTNGDINAATGSSCYESNTYTIVGAGNGIAGTTDGFRFAYQPFNDDGYIITRVDSQENTHDFAKAGIMIREGTGANARNVFLGVTPNNSIRFQWRTSTGFATSKASVTGQPPVWLRLERNGNAYTASYSADKVNWTEIRTQTVEIGKGGASVYAGFAVSSRNNARLSEAVFTGWEKGISRAINITIVDGEGNAINGQGQVTVTPPNTVCTADCTIGTLEDETVVLTPTATIAGYGFTGWSGDCTGSSSITLTMDKTYNCTATFALTCDPVPAGWTAHDIGAVAAAGHTCYTPAPNETFTVSGSGVNIWGDHDEFQYAYEGWSGDGTITAYLVSQENTGGYAKAGVMFRDALTDSSLYAMTSATPSPGTRFQYRDAGSEVTEDSYIYAPVWVRVTRVGDTFTGYRSDDGSNWTWIGSRDITMTDPIYVGLAVTSFDDGTLSTAVFTDVTITSP